MSVERKKRLFELGCAAFTRATGCRVKMYVCPLCFAEFNHWSHLTFEHVPPQSVGGKAICLMCAHCNSTAGHFIDAAVHAEEAISRFLQRGSGPVRAVLQIGGKALRVKVERTEGTMIQVIGKANDPCVIEQVQNHLRHVPDAEMQLVYRSQYTRKTAEVGLLKAAYLGAFAKFGYRYVLRQCLDPVRRQILEPQKNHFDAIRVWIRDGTFPLHAMLLFHAPVKCVGAKMNDSLILLPWIEDSSTDHWEWLRAMISERTVMRLGQGKLLAWPKGLEMALDSAAE